LIVTKKLCWVFGVHLFLYFKKIEKPNKIVAREKKRNFETKNRVQKYKIVLLCFSLLKKQKEELLTLKGIL